MKAVTRTGKLANGRIGFVYILPWLIGFLALQLYPMVASLYYSFTNYSMGGNEKWVGLKNYIDIFTRDSTFSKSVRATLIFVIAAVPLKLAFALLVAAMLKQNRKGIGFFRTAYYLPSVLSGSIATSILWRALFRKNGYIDQLFLLVGLKPIGWFATPDMALLNISLLTAWQFGSSMVLFLSGLQQIPTNLYEAAQIDGAGAVRRFLNITLPMLSPTIFFNVIMQTINAFQEYTSAAIITHGGPMRGTYLYGMKLYDEAFVNYRMGYASALSWVLFAVILVFTLLMFKSSSKWVYYEDGGVFDV